MLQKWRRAARVGRLVRTYLARRTPAQQSRAQAHRRVLQLCAAAAQHVCRCTNASGTAAPARAHLHMRCLTAFSSQASCCLCSVTAAMLHCALPLTGGTRHRASALMSLDDPISPRDTLPHCLLYAGIIQEPRGMLPPQLVTHQDAVLCFPIACNMRQSPNNASEAPSLPPHTPRSFNTPQRGGQTRAQMCVDLRTVRQGGEAFAGEAHEHSRGWVKRPGRGAGQQRPAISESRWGPGRLSKHF